MPLSSSGKASYLRVFLLLAILLGFIGLSQVARSEFTMLIGLYAIIFACYALMIYKWDGRGLILVLIAVLTVRIPFFWNLPQLSDDYFRFLWDGMLLNEGLNPFGRIPIDQRIGNFTQPEFAETLISGMNSPGYMSVYPPFHQFVFGIAYFFSGPNLLQGVNTMRCIIIFFELAFTIFLFLRKGNELKYGCFYLLNPLVVVEGVGNVHFEAILLPWLAASLLWFDPRGAMKSALTYGGAVLVKLTPLMLAPAFLFRYRKKAAIQFLLWSFGSIAVFFMMLEPWYIFENFGKGIGLYFQRFEFNASIYYVLREFIALFIGYNSIAVLAPSLGALAFALILLVAFRYKRANIMEVSLVSYLIFLLLSTTVHPWYIIPLVYLAIRSGRLSILVWSFTVVFSYAHYLGEIGPPWGLIAIEYILLFAALSYEQVRKPWLQSVFRG